MPDLVPWSGIEPMPPALGAQSFFFFLINLFIYLFIYFWLCWVFVSVRGLSLVAASGGQSSSRCAGLSLSQPLLLRGTGSGHAGSVVVAHGPSCSAACGIFPDQGSNPCPLHWQADSQPLCHQGSLGAVLTTGPPRKSLLVLISVSLVSNYVEHLFICFLAICLPFLEKCLLKSFDSPIFFIWVVCLFVIEL